MKKFMLSCEIKASVRIEHDESDPIEAETIEQARDIALREAESCIFAGEVDIDESLVYDEEELIEDEDEDEPRTP